VTGRAVELLGGVWPVLAPAAVAGGAWMRAARRRLQLNRAMHELRRPLQALALSPGEALGHGSAEAPGPLDLALMALEDMDFAVNGHRPAASVRPVSARAVVHAALERWRPLAARADRSLSLEWHAGSAVVMADPPRLAQALDNLLANAVEHGGLRISVEASIRRSGLRIAVADGGADGRVAARARDPRRGHGLDVVRRIAAAHGGSFELRREVRGMVAALELPLAAGT